MDFVIRQHMLLKQEREWLILCVGVQRSRFILKGWRNSRIYDWEDGERIWYQCALYPSLNLELKVCSYSLTSFVSFALPFTNTFWTRSKHVSSIYSSSHGTPFHFPSQRSKSTDLWSAAHPLNNSWHWLVFFLIFFPVRFFLVGIHGCAVGGFYSFSSFIKASPHLFMC